MMVSARRFRSIGWIALLLVCTALVMVLAFRVNALRSQVHRTELKIIALRKERLYLETEVETRANQQQLKLWNDVEFGFVAPSAGQYLANERQLAAFAKPEGPDAPEPIRVASADDAIAAEAAFPSVIARLAGQADLSAPAAPATETEEKPATRPADAAERAAATANLGARLAMGAATAKGAKEKVAGKRSDADRKAGLAKAAKGEAKGGSADRPGKSARLASAKPEAKPGKAAAAKPAKPQAKPAKPATKGSKPTP